MMMMLLDDAGDDDDDDNALTQKKALEGKDERLIISDVTRRQIGIMHEID